MNGAKRRVGLLSIVEYIAQDNLDAALALVTEIEEKAERLREQPKLYRPGRVRGTREMVVRPNYVVVYSESTIAVTIPACLARCTDVAARTPLMECCSSD